MGRKLRSDERSDRLAKAGSRGGAGTRAKEPSGWSTPPPIKTGERAKPKRRGLKIALGLFVCFLLLLAIGLIFAPALLSGPARGMVESALNDQINGKAEVENLKLSWTGGQTAGPVIIRDADGERVARVHLKLEKGLLALAGMNLGEVRVDGDARIVRGADGVTNLERVFEPMLTKSDTRGDRGRSGGGGGDGGGLPKNLRGTLILDTISVLFIDETMAQRSGGSVGAVSIKEMTGEASFAVGKPITLDLDAEITTAASETRLTNNAVSAGLLKAKVKATGFTKPSGALSIEDGSIEALISATRVSVAALDAVAGQEGRLVEALGATVDASVNADGPMDDMTASFSAVSDSLNAAGTLTYDGKTLRQTEPVTVTAQTQRLMALAPELRTAMLRGEQARLEALPDVTLAVQSLSLPLDAEKLSDGTLDLRGGSIEATLSAAAMRGSADRPFSTEPIMIALSAPNLAEPITLTANTKAEVGGQPAGVVDARIVATGLLDNAGALREGGPSNVEARVSIDELATAVVQPFAAASGLVLREDLGPSLSMSLTATTSPGELKGGGVPNADAAFELASANVTARGDVTVRDGVLTAGGDGVEARMARVGPTLDRFLGAQGARIQEGGAAEVRVKGLRVDLNKAQAGDLRGIEGDATITLDAIAGSFAPDGGAAQAFNLRPTRLVASMVDPKGDVRVSAEPTGETAGQGGSIRADLLATGLLDDTGAIAGMPRSLAGNVQLANVPTAIAQPFVAARGLNLPRDVGPQLTLTLSADARAVPGGASLQSGAIPETDLSFALNAAHLEATGAMRLGEGALRVVGEGVEISARRAGAMAAAFVGRDGPVTIEGAGGASVRIASATIPLDGQSKPDLANAAMDAEMTLGGVTAYMASPSQSPTASPALGIDQLRLKATRAKGEALIANAEGRMAYAGEAFGVEANMRAPGLIEQLVAGTFKPDPGSMPIGELKLTGVPTALVRMANIELEAQGGQAIDEVALTQQIVGKTMDLTLTGDRPGAGAYGVRANIASQGLNSDVVATLKPNRLEVGKSEARLTVAPGSADTLIRAFAPAVQNAVAQPIRLTSPLVATFEINPTAVALTPEFGVDAEASKGEKFNAVLTLNGETSPIVLKGDPATGEPGLNLGPTAMRDLRLGVAGFVPSVLPGNGAGTLQAKLSGRITGESNKRLASLNGTVRRFYRGGKADGPFEGSVTLEDLSTALADVVVGTPGLVSGAMGPAAAIEILLDAEGDDNAALRANIKSERFNTTKPLVLDRDGDKLMLRDQRPMVASWTMTPEWATRFLLGQNNSAATTARFTEPATWQLNLRRLAISRREGGGPFRPGVFDLQAILSAPKLAIQSGGQRLDVEGARADLWSPVNTRQFELRMKAAKVAGQAMEENDQFLTATLQNAYDELGNPTFADATLNGGADIRAFPTGILDALAKQNGLLVELLGPTITLDADANQFSKAGGHISVVATSQRAHAVFQGNVQDGVLLTIPDGSSLKIDEITKELSARVTKSVPIAAQFEKKRGDDPAQIRIQQIALPLDNDIRKLNGRLTIDPGVLRFQTSNLFQGLLKVGKQKDAGVLGERLTAMPVTITNGVITYGKGKDGRYELPLGDFTSELEGIVDLPQKKLDVVVWVPFGGVAADAAGAFGAGALPIIDKATLMPFRVKGPIDNPGKAKPDADLFAKNVLPNLLKGAVDPAQGLGEGIKKILDGQDPLKDILPKE